MSLTAILMTLVVGFFLWGRVQTHSIQAVQQQLDYWQPILAAIRWTMIGMLTLAWPYLCQWLAQSGILSNEKARQLTALRWRMVGWLFVIELILGQGLLVKVLATMAGKTG